MKQTVVHPLNNSLYYRAVGLFDWHFARFDWFCQRYNKVMWNDDFDKNGARLFSSHHETVRRLVPPERLLEFRAVQGWEPLCKFLDKPVPTTPYPRTHSAQEFHDGDKAEIRRKYIAVFRNLALVAATLTTLGWAYWIRRQ
jgi:Sulfotransferase domain